tara:strand:+ start:354 stop:1442 length:1089 start_codon:yes stop_codon:yes gene_type:complete
LGVLGIKQALEVYKDKKVLITGNTGFKGTWLSYILEMLGANVIGYALPLDIRNEFFNELNLCEKINQNEGNVCDSQKLNNLIKSVKPDFIFHLAAQALVKESYKNPAETMSTNIMGTVNILDAVKLSDDVQVLLCITSDKCYENNEWIWGYRENDRLGGHDPYSASKAAAEIIFNAYSKSFLSQKYNLGFATARAGNVIGGGDWSLDRIIPDCIKAIQHKKILSVRNPNAVRPWQHVLEPLSGYLLLGANLYKEKSRFNGAWNFGPDNGEQKNVGEITKFIMDYFNKKELIKIDTSSNLHEAQLLQLNCDKANQILKWYPRWKIDKTLTKTVEWYESSINRKDIELITKNQILDYFKEMKGV